MNIHIELHYALKVITTSHICEPYSPKARFLSTLLCEFDIRAPILLNLFNLFRKSNQMLDKPHIRSLFPKSFNRFNNTRALV